MSPDIAKNTMAAALMQELDRMAESSELSEGNYLKLCGLLKQAKVPGSDSVSMTEAQECCRVLFAEPGDVFEHHYYRQYDEPNDNFEFVGRTSGDSCTTPVNWLVFRHIPELEGRGICANGCKRGLNGGVLDAIGAWPLRNYRNYRSDGTFDDQEIALPASKCWGFRLVEQIDEDEEEEWEESDEEEDEEEGDEEEESEEEEGERVSPPISPSLRKWKKAKKAVAEEESEEESE